MKVHLMYQNRDFEKDKEIECQEQALTQDLELNTLFDAMSNNDNFILEVSKTALFSGLSNPEEIIYRQNILKDCIKMPSVVREIYTIASEAVERRRNYWFGVGSDSPSSILQSSVRLLQMLVLVLKKLRKVIDEHEKDFESNGFITLINMIQLELDDRYLLSVQTHLNDLEFENGVLVSAELGQNNNGVNYVLRSQKTIKHSWLKWRIAPSLYIHERDDNGLMDLGKRQNRAINQIADVLRQSAEHVLSFFIMLKTEIAFYVGCLNLYETLLEKDEEICFPIPVDFCERRHSFKGLYDVCLSLLVENRVVGNDVDADNKQLAIITGANQGGKSTFLRSIGQAQLMMQCGMFVAAESFCANMCDGIFTHYKREEDAGMKSGKLDEELGRMSNIADFLRPNSLMLFNESFAATNEREGSEIGRQIVCALLEKKIKVFFVTHLYEFANNFHSQNMNNTIFLSAERKADGYRTFKITEGEPLQTSYGEDLYLRIFGSEGRKFISSRPSEKE